MEYLGKMLKKTGYVSILESIVFIILGAILVWKADLAIKVISIILGVIFIVIGAVKIIEFFWMNRKYADVFNYELIYGLMAVVIGIVTICYSSTIETILRIIIGIWIIYSSIIKLTLTVKMKRIESKAWIYSLIFAIIMFVCGIFVIANSGILVATLGVVMIIYSILDIIDDILCIKYIKEVL